MSQEKKRKTPTARYIAACLMIRSLDSSGMPTCEQLSDVFETRIGDVKRQKIMEVFLKLGKKMKERMQKLKDNFENPKPRKLSTYNLPHLKNKGK